MFGITRRFLTSLSATQRPPKELPILTIPKYLESKIQQVRVKRLEQRRHKEERRLAGLPSITSRFKKAERNGCLHSAGWARKDYEGDQITIKDWIKPELDHIFMRPAKTERDAVLLKIIHNNIIAAAAASASNNKKKSSSGSGKYSKIVIFVRNEDSCNWLAHFLDDNNITHTQLSGFAEEAEKRQTYREFEYKKPSPDSDLHGKILICKDWGSLSLADVELIINFHLPPKARDYLARCRAAQKSLRRVVSFVGFKEEVLVLNDLERLAKSNDKDPWVAMGKLLEARGETEKVPTPQTRPHRKSNGSGTPLSDEFLAAANVSEQASV